MAEINGVSWSILVEYKDDLGRVCCPHCGEWYSMQRTTYYKYHYLGRCLKSSNDGSDEDKAKVQRRLTATVQ